MTKLPARHERALLCDLLLAVGPDAPTRCGDWTTRELVAHLRVREQRPDAMLGILAGGFDSRVAGRLERHHGDVVTSAAHAPYASNVEAVRTGPPSWSPLSRRSVDRAMNTTEFFVHHEDVRRAQPDWTPRDLDRDLADDLDAMLAERATRLAAPAPCGLLLRPTGRAPILARRALPTVEVHGTVGELTLFLLGRVDQADVTIDVPADAPADLADRLRATDFSI